MDDGRLAMKLTLIEPPQWASESRLTIDGLTAAEYEQVRQHRGAMLAVVHRELERYVNDPELCWDGPDAFPQRDRLAGNYYLSAESYSAHRDPDWVQIGVLCHLMEKPTRRTSRDDDYLGLQVWLRCTPPRWTEFKIYRNTDSSAI